jgi:predicted phosphodiesterase
MQLEKWLIIPDCHVPFHDRRAFALMLRAAKKLGIKNAAILGDFADFYSVSSHPKPPGRVKDLKWETDQVHTSLDEIEEVITGKKEYVQGNHEERLERYLTDKAPELFSTVKFEKIMRLKERGWKYTPYRSHTKIGRLFLTHDCGKVGRLAHVDAMNAFQGNVVIGHTHRLGYAVEGNVKGKPHVGAQLGWLGDFEQVEYMHKIRAARDWVHGFGIAYVEGNGNVHLTPVPIVGGKVLAEGKLIR